MHGPDTLTVAPNAVLDRHGLRIDCQPARLRHVNDLAALAFNTSAQVATLLDEMFPANAGCSDDDGQVRPSNEPPGAQYTQQARMLLHHGEPGKRQGAGRALLRWCLLMDTMVRLTGGTANAAPGAHRVIRLLLEQGPTALLRDASEPVDRAVDDAAWWDDTPVLLNGESRRSDESRPEAVVLTIPWLEAMGVDMGGPTRLMGHLCTVMTDVYLTLARCELRLNGGHVLWAPEAIREPLLQAFEQAQRTHCSVTNEVCAVLVHDRGTTRFRSVRSHLIDSGVLYAFRRLNDAPPPLTLSAMERAAGGSMR